MNRWALWLAVASVSLLACSDELPTKAERRARVQERIKKNEALLSKTPEQRTYRIDGNELKVVDLFVRDNSGFLEQQRCFVWRDVEFKSASLSCAQVPDVILGDPHAEP